MINDCGCKTAAETKYTYRDYLQLPDEPGYRFEILNGELVKEPSPDAAHQFALEQLNLILYGYFQEVDPEGLLYFTPLLKVAFGDTTVVQPDIFFVSGRQKSILKGDRIGGPPVLVIEILSPDTRRKDRLKKRQVYQYAQVQHYWLVDPEMKTLECFSLRDGLYAVVASGMEEEVVEHPSYPGLAVDLKNLWGQV